MSRACRASADPSGPRARPVLAVRPVPGGSRDRPVRSDLRGCAARPVPPAPSDHRASPDPSGRRGSRGSRVRPGRPRSATTGSSPRGWHLRRRRLPQHLLDTRHLRGDVLRTDLPRGSCPERCRRAVVPARLVGRCEQSDRVLQHAHAPAPRPCFLRCDDRESAHHDHGSRRVRRAVLVHPCVRGVARDGPCDGRSSRASRDPRRDPHCPPRHLR